MKRKLICAAVVLGAGQIFFQQVASAQSGCTGKSEIVVREVSMEAKSHLSAKQLENLKSKLVGRCFMESQLRETATEVLSAFKEVGYSRALVSEPIVRVLDSSRQPKPVSLLFDVNEGPRLRKTNR